MIASQLSLTMQWLSFVVVAVWNMEYNVQCWFLTAQSLMLRTICLFMMLYW